MPKLQSVPTKGLSIPEGGKKKKKDTLLNTIKGTIPENTSSVTCRTLSLTSWIQSAYGYHLALLYQLGLHLLLRAQTLKSFPAGQHPPRHKSAELGVSGWPKTHLLGHSNSKNSKRLMSCVRGKASAILLSPLRGRWVRFSAGNQVGGPKLAWPSLALTLFWLSWPLALPGAVQNVCSSLIQSTCASVLLATAWMQPHISTGWFLCAWGLNFYDEYVEMFGFPKRLILWPFGTFSIQTACLWDMCNSNLSTLPIALECLD